MRTLVEFVEAKVGSSFPTLCRVSGGENGEDDRANAVLKMRGAGNGARSLVSEFIINRVAHLLGWPVPDVFLITIPSGFPWSFGTDEFDDLVQRSFGENLGLQLIEGAESLSGSESQSLSAEFKARTIALDLFFANIDRTLQSRNLLRDHRSRPWIIDHGGCLLFQTRRDLPLNLCAGHIYQDEMSALRVLIRENLARLAGFAGLGQVIQALPQSWLLEAGCDSEDLESTWRRQVNKALSF